jgi:hypothetical protein
MAASAPASGRRYRQHRSPIISNAIQWISPSVHSFSALFPLPVILTRFVLIELPPQSAAAMEPR